ncbi:MAG: hypothetical protein KatS3mg085_761 [Candidatus Dojkabacteria bacterium]|nr:MAG: hypothetical protein KatS3mg085_761 [Candidatus Dojkabacteria bacterium]
MEPHPVPQNILDIEFKLFGSFTLKQFGKMLIGCMVGLFFFILPINFFVKFPFVAGSILVGVLSALVPTFQTWITGFTKALFISPRYVWIKDKVNYELLNKSSSVKPDKETIQAAKNRKKIDISEIPLDKLFVTQTSNSNQQSDNDENQVKDQNFQRVYAQEFQNEESKSVNSKQPKNFQNENSLSPEQEINLLQTQLENLDMSDPNYKAKSEELMMKIAEVRSRVKLKGRYDTVARQGENLVDAQGQKLNNYGQEIFGIVVDRQDNPIDQAQIFFQNLETKQQFNVVSDGSGKFSTMNKLPIGTYLISIKHPKFKFDNFKIIVSSQKLPAYKFKAR